MSITEYNRAEPDKAEGTSLKASIETTYDILEAILGPAYYYGPGYNDSKVTREWVLTDQELNEEFFVCSDCGAEIQDGG